jgi:hypothetical protein
MRIGRVIIILMFVFPMTAGADPPPDKAKGADLKSAGGVIADVKDDDFIFVYSSRSGANVAKDMQMWETSLTVDSRSGLATLEMNRDYGDDAGQAIGRFEMSVGRDALERLRAQLESGSFTGLEVEGKHEMLNESLLTMTYKTAKRTIVKTVGSGERRWQSKLEPLMEEIHKLQSGLRSHPKAALRLKVRHIVRDKKEYFELDFVNEGRESVYLMNPQARGNEGEWTGVKVAVYHEEERGVIPAPPSWERIPVLHEQGTDVGNASVRIDPGKKYVMRSRLWHPEHCGVTYGAQGVMINYQGAGAGDGISVIRGGLFSNMISAVTCRDGEDKM